MKGWKFKCGDDALDEEGTVVRIDVRNCNAELEKRYLVKYPDLSYVWKTEKQLTELSSLKTNNKKEKKNAPQINSRSKNKKVAS